MCAKAVVCCQCDIGERIGVASSPVERHAKVVGDPRGYTPGLDIGHRVDRAIECDCIRVTIAREPIALGELRALSE